MTTTFATIELNSGYVWWVGAADDAADACARSDAETGGEYGRKFDQISRSEINSSAGGYAVYEVPAGFDVTDGQNEEQIAAVEAQRLVGYFRAVSEE